MPDLHRDGWSLDDAEVRQKENPQTFHIPDIRIRRALRPGDLAKLIFKLAVDDEAQEAVERMWVVVSERLEAGVYIGLLDNQPSEIAENDVFWLGSELPFEARHVIDADMGDEKTRAWAARGPLSRWPRG
ncbi:hypothetical protein [Brevundimonas sp. NIBR10]|uniref:hypothetical protein n=1 Tax=Brevundimonas sp. NIBR10 TaxID=3015997 RepID=UPI0022F1C6F1|nr:hypothetical protein [Brevundimonas sp. NIBR10]